MFRVINKSLFIENPLFIYGLLGYLQFYTFTKNIIIR